MFEWLEKHRQTGGGEIQSTQGSTPGIDYDKKTLQKEREREAERELDDFLRKKKKADGVFTKKDREEAIEEFKTAGEAQDGVSVPELDKKLTTKEESIVSRIISMLSGKLIPGGREDGKVVGSTADTGLSWVPGLPTTANPGDLMRWEQEDGEDGSWVKYVPSKNVVVWFDSTTDRWNELEVPAVDGKFIQSTSTGTPKFDYPVYTA